ncbi:MAG: hypothetical protein V2A65_06000 [Candidatus Omnitrophota bacterium]
MKTKIILLTLLTFLFCGIMFAAEEKGTEKKDVTRKTLTGEVSGLGPNFIAITYQVDTAKGVEYEMALPLKKDAQFQFIKSLKELGIGDKVSVIYEEEKTSSVENVNDKEEVKESVKREATLVRLEGKAPSSAIYTGSE